MRLCHLCSSLRDRLENRHAMQPYRRNVLEEALTNTRDVWARARSSNSQVEIWLARSQFDNNFKLFVHDETRIRAVDPDDVLRLIRDVAACLPRLLDASADAMPHPTAPLGAPCAAGTRYIARTRQTCHSGFQKECSPVALASTAHHPPLPHSPPYGVPAVGARPVFPHSAHTWHLVPPGWSQYPLCRVSRTLACHL